MKKPAPDVESEAGSSSPHPKLLPMGEGVAQVEARTSNYFTRV